MRVLDVATRPLLLGLLASPLVAQTIEPWHPIRSLAPPHAAAWDPGRQSTVLITYDGDWHHWEWDGSTAERRITADLGVSNLVWLGTDPIHDRLLAVAPPSVGTWDGTVWSWQTSSNAPAVSFASRFAFDSHRQRLVAYDGSQGTNDMHEWDGSQWWSTTNATGPTPRTDAAFAYDPISQRCVLYGGTTTSGQLDDCWRWDGSLWTSVASGAPPGPRSAASMAFDPGLGALLLYGGSTTGTTWRLAGNTWTQLTTLNDPGPRSHALLVQDPNGMLLIGGTGDPFDTAWRFTGTDWTPLSTFAAPPWRRLSSVATDRARNQIVLFGGGAPTSHGTHVYDTRWYGTAPAASPPPRNLAHMCWSSIDQRVLLFGGGDGNNTRLGDTWSWTGSDWLQHTPTQSPPARVGAAIAEDPNGGVLLFGGRDGTTTFADHWHWNGTQWSPVTTAVMPAGYTFLQAALDPITNRVVLVRASETWLWDGALWSQATPSPAMYFGSPNALAFDPKRGRLVTASIPWHEWTGTSWNQLGIAIQLPGQLVGLIEDPARQRLLAVAETGALIVAQLTDEPASVIPFGFGCAIGPSPVLHALQDPVVGNGDFTLEVATVTPSTPTFLVLGLGSQNQPFGGGCSLLVGQQIATMFGSGTPNGQIRLPLPIPNAPALRGVEFVAQAAVVDTARSPIGSLTATAALRIVIGD